MRNIIHITDLQNEELKIYNCRSEAQLMHINEPDLGLFIAESPLVIERALSAGYTPVSMLLEGNRMDVKMAELMERVGDIPIYTAESDVLTEITGFKLTRGALCAMRRKPLPAMQGICENAKRIAIMENVVNPTNVGAIFRSAAALSFDAVLLTDTCSNPLYRRAIRVSMGTVFQISWTILDKKESAWPQVALSQLREMGFTTCAMALSDNSISIADKRLHSAEKLAVILGAEGTGLLPETIASCDYTVKIPINPEVDSLNVAAASAVAFWELARR